MTAATDTPPAGPPGGTRRPARKRPAGQGRRGAAAAAAVVVIVAAGLTAALLLVPGAHKPRAAAAGRSPAPAAHTSAGLGNTGPASQGNSTAGPSASAAPPVTLACAAPIYGACLPQNMQSEPATMQLSGDGTLTLTHIVWQHWGNSEATGTGQYAIRSCTPTCASGTTTDQPGQVLLTGLVAYNGGMAYDDITLVTPAGVQPATGDHIAGTVP